MVCGELQKAFEGLLVTESSMDCLLDAALPWTDPR